MSKARPLVVELPVPLDRLVWTRDGEDASAVFSSGVRGQETVRLDLQFGGTVCPPGDDRARQEYALSADLSYQVQRFGVGAFGPVGEIDSDMDLTAAFELVERSREAWFRLPKVVRDRYGSWRRVEEAAASGELEQVLKSVGLDGGSVPSKAPDSGGSGGTTPGGDVRPA